MFAKKTTGKNNRKKKTRKAHEIKRKNKNNKKSTQKVRLNNNKTKQAANDLAIAHFASHINLRRSSSRRRLSVQSCVGFDSRREK